jgi:hypothetical protein
MGPLLDAQQAAANAAAGAEGQCQGGSQQQQQQQQLESAPSVQGWLPASSSGWGATAQQAEVQQQQQQGLYHPPAAATAAGAEDVILQQDYLQAVSNGFPAVLDGSGAAAVLLILQPGAAGAPGSLISQQFATGGELLLLPDEGALPPGVQPINLADLDIPKMLHVQPDGSLRTASGSLHTGLIGGTSGWGVGMLGAAQQGQFGVDGVLLPDRAARAAAAAAARRHRKQVRNSRHLGPTCYCDMMCM